MEKILANHIFDEELISKTCNSVTTDQTILLKMGRVSNIPHAFPKETY